jgi:hypothetical protein
MDKKTKIHFTNEELSKKFKSNFDLVNYAIRLVENMIKTGRDPRVKSDMQNRAMLILEEINEGKDQFDEIPESTQLTEEGIDANELRVQDRSVDEREKRKYRTIDALEHQE